MDSIRNKAGADSRRFFFGQDRRIKKRKVFLQVYGSGKSFRRKGLHVFVLQLEDHSAVTQLGVTATKKIGNSVIRNRSKRRLREVFRLTAPEISPGYLIVLNALHSTAEFPFEKLLEQFRSALNEAGILSADQPQDDNP